MALKAETAALEADEHDRTEMRQVAAMMEELRAPRLSPRHPASEP